MAGGEGREVLQELASLATDLGPALNPAGHDELLQAIVESARHLFRAAGASVAVLDHDAKELVFYIAAGDKADSVVGLRVPVGSGIAGWVVATGQPVAIEDTSRDARFARETAETIGYVPTSILAVPLETKREMLGVIELLDWERTDQDTLDDMELLGSFAQLAALAIESSRVFTDLGRALFAAASHAPISTDLKAALDRVVDDASPHRAELADLAAQFHELAELGPEERTAASRLVGEFLEYVRKSRS